MPVILFKFKWCFDGVCKGHGWQPEPVDGGWGSWSGWGSCTKPCGVGIRSTERQCDNPM